MNIAFTDIMKAINESLARIIDITMNYSQFLQDSTRKDISSVKTYFNGTRDKRIRKKIKGHKDSQLPCLT